ncbi:MAG: T9SS type A sorting domain-containing protein, partial [Syntrophothermus sp.]
FNPTTNISFSIAMDGNVKLSVYNILGQEVAQLVNGFLKAGVHKINFDASSLSTGTYFYKITANNYSEVKKLSLVK